MDKNQGSVIERIDEMMRNQVNKQAEEDQLYIQSLPKEFIGFLKEKEIMIEELLVPIPRYIRIKPNKNIQQPQILKSLSIPQSQLVKLDSDFYALSPSTKINKSPLYQQALLYGIDYSSSIPVRCLSAQEGHRVLELCSAPGNKAMYLADMLQEVSIVGVEIGVNRANVMRSLVSKYGLEGKIQVVVADGVEYDCGDRFDRVLVDAECTHEGSIKHIKKFFPQPKSADKMKKNEVKAKKNLTAQQKKQFHINNSNHYTTEVNKANEWSVQDFKQRFLDEKKLNNLSKLQLGLLRNGFRLLKQGGILVYSTCSFDTGQNQDIVEEFLDGNENARLMDCREGLTCAVQYQEGKIKQCIRFRPSISRCGGMFVSKIQKLPTPKPEIPKQQ